MKIQLKSQIAKVQTCHPHLLSSSSGVTATQVSVAMITIIILIIMKSKSVCLFPAVDETWMRRWRSQTQMTSSVHHSINLCFSSLRMLESDWMGDAEHWLDESLCDRSMKSLRACWRRGCWEGESVLHGATGLVVSQCLDAGQNLFLMSS